MNVRLTMPFQLMESFIGWLAEKTLTKPIFFRIEKCIQPDIGMAYQNV